MILSPNFAVKAENCRFLAHAAANLPVFGPEPALEGHMNRFFCAYSFVTGLQCMLAPQVRSIDMCGHETTGLLGCDFRYRHRRLGLQKGPKISTMVVIDDINLPLYSCSFVLGSIQAFWGYVG